MVNDTETKCFSCGRRLPKTKQLVDTRDDQKVWVGPDCHLKVREAGELGYQPPLGGPKLYPLKWPSFTADNSAWQQAKAELGPDATFSEVALRAQQLKEAK